VDDGLDCPRFKALVLECLADDGAGPGDRPTDKDLDTAFVLADEDQSGLVDEVEFLTLYRLVKTGQVGGLGKSGGLFGSSKKASFRRSFKEGTTPEEEPPATDASSPRSPPGKSKSLTPRSASFSNRGPTSPKSGKLAGRSTSFTANSPAKRPSKAELKAEAAKEKAREANRAAAAAHIAKKRAEAAAVLEGKQHKGATFLQVTMLTEIPRRRKERVLQRWTGGCLVHVFHTPRRAHMSTLSSHRSSHAGTSSLLPCCPFATCSL